MVRSMKHHTPHRQVAAPAAAAQRIVSAARRHFLAHGFRGVTMDDIAAELGMSKKSLYACFASKEDIVRAVLLNKFQEIDADLSAITDDKAAGVMERLRQLLACLQKHTEEIHPPFVRDMQRAAPELFQMVQRRRRELIKRTFGGLLAEGRKAGLFRADIPAWLIVEILLGAAEAIMNPAKMAELKLTPRTGLVAILSVILEGAVTAKGRATMARKT